MADLQEISVLAQQFVSQPTMNPEKIKASANLLSMFLPEKVAGAVIPVAGLLDGAEISVLIKLALKILETFFPQIGPFVPRFSENTEVAPVTISAPEVAPSNPPATS